MGRFDLEAGSVSLRTLLEFSAAARRVGAEVDAGRWLVRPYVAGVEVAARRVDTDLRTLDPRETDPRRLAGATPSIRASRRRQRGRPR